MPAYEYKCRVCDTIEVVIKSFIDESVPECCEKPMVKNFNVGGVYIH